MYFQIQGVPNVPLIGIALALLVSLPLIRVRGSSEAHLFTEEEREALKKFHKVVDGILTQKFMRDDAYLINWLKAHDLNIPAATEVLKRTLKWRAENNIDNILNEDFPEAVSNEFPIYMDGIDYLGRPVVTMPVGQYNIRRSILGRNTNLLRRGSMYFNERLLHRILELNAKSNGTLINQAIHILDMDGFNLRTHGCIQCITFFTETIFGFFTYYPNMINTTIFINAPRALETLGNILRPVIPESAAQNSKLYGHNKAEWQAAILKLVPESQIRPQFGGTKRD